MANVSISRSTIALIAVIMVFVFVNIIISYFIIVNYSNLSACNTLQGGNCPTIVCNTDDAGNVPSPSNFVSAPDGSNPASCWPYAYREVKDDSGTLLSYQCSEAFVGRTSVNDA